MSPAFIEALLRWYRDCRADLPWRRDPSPYHVWLSEVMLQQTQVETVIPYFQRFIDAFPTIADLARAPLADVLKLWEGLGYYSRARNLHRAARAVVAEHGGALPGDLSDLLALPGIGRYSAGAIASIAFGRRAAVLDGNVTRLITRLLDLDDDIVQGATKKKLWSIAAEWLPFEGAGEYNQALMELGQKVCKPRNPRCDVCLVQPHCRAFARGTVALRPVRTRRAPTPHYDVAAGLIRDGEGRLLIAQRPLDGLLGGLWEFPGGKVEGRESLAECLRRELCEELAIDVAVGPLFAVVDHAFTHFKITLHAFECHYLGALPPYQDPQAIGALDWAWAREEELGQYSFGKADRQVIAELQRRREMLL
ncbi:MAG: A/G-specific adenine glycosylase [Chloroflexi bacterium]|nr:A/G-specific adenine glycosylase [Chloroflexota bacterium]